MPAPRRGRLVLLALALLGAAVALVVGPSREFWNETAALADAHTHHEAGHSGWTFPARVWSAPASLDLPAKRLALHAKARGYAETCPPVEPGEYCPKTGAVVPRGGRFPEGVQPPGTDGWTRPVALEPVLVGWLVDPDGEIREHLPLADAPLQLIAAIVAAEDEDFRSHHGVNVLASARAAWANARGGGYAQGASTLTMQVVRTMTGRREKTIGRKLVEMGQALVVDRHLGKDGVLQMYLDAPYLGQQGDFPVCGFQAAARHYWGVDASDLTLAQAATLAAILPAPGRYAPDRFPDAAGARRDLVLARMAESGWDSHAVEAARAEPIALDPHPLPAARYTAYFQATRVWLEENLPHDVVYGAGLDVWTALDVVAQEQSEKLLPERTRYLERAIGLLHKEPLQSAGVLLDAHTGRMVAVYGGAMGLATDFSRATQAKRQPGSSFKPLVYALALDQVDAATGAVRFPITHAVPNSRRVFPDTNGWNPRNVGDEYTPTATLAYGLAWSQNIATASLLEQAGGPDKLIAFAKAAGFDTRSFAREMGLALGQAEVTPLEMARFVATVIDGGLLASGSPVELAVDAAGVERIRGPEPGPRVLREEAAVLTRELMRLVIDVGTGGTARGGGGFPGYTGPAAGKTGTTDSEKDLWFVGGTPTYAGAIWLGYDQPARIGATASDLASPLWGWWMRAVHEGLPEGEFDVGPAVERKAVCTVTGKYGNGSCHLIPAPFLPGMAPDGVCHDSHAWPEKVEGEEKPWEGLWKRKERERLEAEGVLPPEEGAAPQEGGPPGGDTAGTSP